MSSILEEIETKIAGLKTSTTKSNVGVVRETGDGVARIEGLSDVMLNEMIEFPERRLRARSQSRGNRGRRHSCSATPPRYRKATRSKRPVDLLSSPGRARRCSAAWSTRSVSRSMARAPIKIGNILSAGKNRTRRHQAAQRQSTGADRHHGDRRDDSDRSRPARVDHRRSRDR